MDWVKKHADTVIVLTALFGGFLWINGKFNDKAYSHRNYFNNERNNAGKLNRSYRGK